MTLDAISDTACMSVALGCFAASVLLAGLINAIRVHDKHNEEGE